MSKQLDPIARSAVANANELGLVLSELNEQQLLSAAQRLQAEAHAKFWRAVGRAIMRLVRPARTPIQKAAQAETQGEGDLANDNRGQLAA